MIVRTVTRITPPHSGAIGRFRMVDDPTRRAGLQLGGYDGTITIDEWLCRRILGGYRPEAIVAAADGRISIRTAYRWRRRLCGVETIIVGGFRATFALLRDGPPSRLSAWERVG